MFEKYEQFSAKTKTQISNDICVFAGGEGGIRTHVPAMDKTISSRSRYDLFDTSPYVYLNISQMQFWELCMGNVINLY